MAMNDTSQDFWLKNLRVANHYNQWIFSQFSPFLGNQVLEVGCGNGNFTSFLSEYCQSVIALDVNEDYVKATATKLSNKPNVKVILSDVKDIELHNRFDTVVMLDVLEHLEDDVEILRILAKQLKSQGKLIVKVPALNFLFNSMDKAIGHYRRYDRKVLTNACLLAGLQPDFTWYFNFVGIPGWWLNGNLGRVTPPSEQIGLFNNLVPLFRYLENKIKPPIGLSLFIVATKI